MPDEISTVEEWRQIPGWEGLYSVSNLGRVRSERRVIPHSVTGTYTVAGRVLRPGIGFNGYRLCIFRHRGKSKAWHVHRIVALAWIGKPPEDGAMVLHTNGDPHDNRPDNLRYGTHADNMADMVRHGRSRRGTSNSQNKLTREQVLEIRSLCAEGTRVADVAIRYGITRACVSLIQRRVNWAWLK